MDPSSPHDASPRPQLYARSLGPSQLVRALQARDTLHAADQEVTFLMRLERQDPEHASLADVWRYGCGEELGVFALFDEGEEAIRVWDEARLDQDRHHPERSPHHVWIKNASQPLPLTHALYVRDAEELSLVSQSDSCEQARTQLQQARASRGHTSQALEEEAITRALALQEELDALATRQAALLARIDDPTLQQALARHGLPDWLLHTHPEHLERPLRDAIDALYAMTKP